MTVSRLRIALVAAVPLFACVSGVADPADGTGGNGQVYAGGAGTPSYAGNTPQAGTPPIGSGGTPSTGGTPTTGGVGTVGGSPMGGVQNGGVGGTPPEACNFPMWVAKQEYKKGDKVMYMGKGFIATEDNPGYDPLVSTFYWSPYDCTPVMNMGGNGGAGGNPNVGDCVLEKLLPQGETTFHSMFIPPWQGHVEKPLYSYTALCTALKGFGGFASSGNAEADKREVAAFFAHVAKETAFLEQTDEAGQPSTSGDYHGRGAIQLTGQANYQAAGAYLNKDLNGNPGLVSTDAVTNWQTALWFWVIHNNPGTQGTQNCHQAIQAGDFAQTTRIINGGIECPGSDSAKTRAQYYTNNCGLLSVSPGSNTVC